MQALVKMPHIEITARGTIPKSILDALKKEFGDALELRSDDEAVDIRKTRLWEKMEADAGPGDAIKVYRYNLNLTQAALAEELGILPTHVSEMERGKRGISKAMAKRLSKVLKAPVERFV
jgi:DNA-binding XRE family transcriptional regulator